jgi:hypothetical protein
MTELRNRAAANRGDPPVRLMLIGLRVVDVVFAGILPLETVPPEHAVTATAHDPKSSFDRFRITFAS